MVSNTPTTHYKWCCESYFDVVYFPAKCFYNYLYIETILFLCIMKISNGYLC